MSDLIHTIPPHMRAALLRYTKDHIEPGSFLRAVLENNLKEAVARADGINRHRLIDYVTYLYNEAPSACWGSPEKVQAWLDLREL